jgi:hypothetical protein
MKGQNDPKEAFRSLGKYWRNVIKPNPIMKQNFINLSKRVNLECEKYHFLKDRYDILMNNYITDLDSTNNELLTIYEKTLKCLLDRINKCEQRTLAKLSVIIKQYL